MYLNMTENVCTLNVTTELNSDPEYRSKEDSSDDDLCARIETGAERIEIT